MLYTDFKDLFEYKLPSAIIEALMPLESLAKDDKEPSLSTFTAITSTLFSHLKETSAGDFDYKKVITSYLFHALQYNDTLATFALNTVIDFKNNFPERTRPLAVRSSGRVFDITIIVLKDNKVYHFPVYLLMAVKFSANGSIIPRTISQSNVELLGQALPVLPPLHKLYDGTVLLYTMRTILKLTYSLALETNDTFCREALIDIIPQDYVNECLISIEKDSYRSPLNKISIIDEKLLSLIKPFPDKKFSASFHDNFNYLINHLKRNSFSSLLTHLELYHNSFTSYENPKSLSDIISSSNAIKAAPIQSLIASLPLNIEPKLLESYIRIIINLKDTNSNDVLLLAPEPLKAELLKIIYSN